MLKQVGKSALWWLVYIMASTLGVSIAMFISLASRLIDFYQSGEDFMSSFMEYITESLLPGTFYAGIICIIVYVAYKAICKHPAEWKQINFSKAIFCFALGAAFNLIISYVLEFLWALLPVSLTDSATEATAMLDTDTYHWLFLLVSVGIVAPISEEIIFRHGMCRTLAKGNVLMGILLSSIVFGMAHGNLIQGVYTCMMGIVCAIVILNTDNIWYPAFIHMGLNCSSVFASAVPEALSNITLIIIGFTGVLIVVTMLIHRDDIRALLKKPNMIPVLDVKTPIEQIVESPEATENIIPSDINL